MTDQNTISFIQDEKIKTIDFGRDGLEATLTVLNYLRNSATHKGTKEGCAEGDCGACTVVIAELDHNDKVRYTAIDSCLVFLPMLHGKQLITVENLSVIVNKEEVFHPVQQAMVESNGSQCGFCTPGFVMSLFSLYKKENNPGKEEIEDALTGNLCRCTGYKPIIEAAASSCVHNGRDHFTEKEEGIRKMLLEIRGAGQGVTIRLDNQNYFQPKTIAETTKLKKENPEALFLSGATDIALRVTKKHEHLPSIIDLSSVQELKHFQKNNKEIIIGSGLNLEEIKSRVQNDLPALYDILKVFGSRQIRSLATLGGNLGSSSPIGDTIPVLMAYNAQVNLESSSGKRTFNINEFITGYRQTKRNPDEIITSVSIPFPAKNYFIKSYKVSKRKDLDIATVNAGFMLKLVDNKAEDIILAFGGMAATTKRAVAAETFLKGKIWSRETVEEAAEIIYNEFTPISDARSGAEFRRLAAKNLLIKFRSEIKTNT